jgi:hypothetical protein
MNPCDCVTITPQIDRDYMVTQTAQALQKRPQIIALDAEVVDGMEDIFVALLTAILLLRV